MIEIIILIAVCLISTEIIYLKIFRDDCGNFILEKGVSILCGVIVAFFLFGLPWLIAVIPNTDGTVTGNIAYVWYYSVVGGIALFFGGNYLIHKWLKAKEEEAKEVKRMVAKLKSKEKRKK